MRDDEHGPALLRWHCDDPFRRTGNWSALLLVFALLPFVHSAAAQDDAIVPSEADALIRDVFSTEDTSRYGLAADLYLRRLAEPGRSTAELETFSEYVRGAFLVMPKEERPPVRLNTDSEYDDLQRAGAHVATWWRRQDPFPATRRNERVEEHLARVAYASKTFSRTGDETGYDVRGEIFIRLGPPGSRQQVRLNEAVRTFDLVSTSSIPELSENELWLYRHIHDEAYYFFMRDSGRSGYRLSRPSDLIPRRLREGINSQTERGRERADMLLLVMEEVYAQLALSHPIFGSTHDRIVRFRGLPPASGERPNHAARSTLAAANNIETESAGRRDDIVPAGYSQMLELIDELNVASRWARFMDPDGTTRTEIYWSVDPAALPPSRQLEGRLTDAGFTATDEYLLAASVARYTADYHFRDVQTKHFQVQPGEKGLPVQSVTLQGDTTMYSVAIQWADHWALPTADGGIAEGAMLKLSTARIDSLRALESDGARLEMSDLKPVHASGDIPFPFRRLNRANPPELVFEIYNLHFGPDDRTRYTVEYEVARKVGRRASTTRARTSSSSADRRVEERIALDLTEWKDDGSIRITVSITDDVTKEHVARSIEFELDS